MRWIKQALSPLRGQQAEKHAENYLTQQGLILVRRNYRCRRGELDLIMQDANELVFVEVKYRASPSHGKAVDYFHAAKRRKCELAIGHYFQEQGLNPYMQAHRMDLLTIDGQQIQWFKAI